MAAASKRGGADEEEAAAEVALALSASLAAEAEAESLSRGRAFKPTHTSATILCPLCGMVRACVHNTLGGKESLPGLTATT